MESRAHAETQRACLRSIGGRLLFAFPSHPKFIRKRFTDDFSPTESSQRIMDFPLLQEP